MPKIVNSICTLYCNNLLCKRVLFLDGVLSYSQPTMEQYPLRKTTNDPLRTEIESILKNKLLRGSSQQDLEDMHAEDTKYKVRLFVSTYSLFHCLLSVSK